MSCEGTFWRSRPIGRPRTYYRQDNLGWVSQRVMNGVVCNHSVLFVEITPAGIEIALELRERAARYRNADTTTNLEAIAGNQRREHNLVHRIGPHEDRPLVSLSPAHAHDTLIEIEPEAIRTDINQFDHQVRVFDVG